MLLGLKGAERKEWGRERWVLVKTNVVGGGPHWSIGGGLTQARAGYERMQCWRKPK